MGKSVEKYFSTQNRLFKLWIYSIALLPICLCAFWVIFYSIAALYRATKNLSFGHGSEVLIVLPIAIIVVVIQLKLLRSLIQKYRV